MSRHIVGGIVLLAALATSAPLSAQECDQLQRLDPFETVSGTGPDDARARQSMRERANQACESFCNRVNNCGRDQKCRRVTSAAGVPLTSSPTYVRRVRNKIKTVTAEAQLRYCPCACEPEATQANPPRECERIHAVTFRHEIRGMSTITAHPDDEKKATRRAREEMNEMARNACDALCMSIAGCPDAAPCIRKGEALDPADGNCSEKGKIVTCAAILDRCECKCSRP